MSAAETPLEQSSELPKYPAKDDDRGTEADPHGRSTQKAPRWPFALVIVVILVVVMLHLTGIIGPGLP
jgi:hypothetical protein